MILNDDDVISKLKSEINCFSDMRDAEKLIHLWVKEGRLTPYQMRELIIYAYLRFVY